VTRCPVRCRNSPSLAPSRAAGSVDKDGGCVASDSPASGGARLLCVLFITEGIACGRLHVSYELWALQNGATVTSQISALDVGFASCMCC